MSYKVDVKRKSNLLRFCIHIAHDEGLVSETIIANDAESLDVQITYRSKTMTKLKAKKNAGGTKTVISSRAPFHTLGFS